MNKIDSRPFELMMTHSEMQPAGYIKNKAVLLANSRLMAKNTDLAKPFFDVAFESRSKMKEINREQQKEFLARQEFLGNKQILSYFLLQNITTTSRRVSYSFRTKSKMKMFI